MKHLLLVGLGNPGANYKYTRHNLGIRLLRTWADGPWHTDHQHQAEISSATIADNKVTCLFPLTSMNLSGQAVASLKHPPENTLLIHDDLKLPLGNFKFKPRGSARGHNGVRSIHNYLGTQDIPRLLLGIGPVTGPTEEFVLAKFTPAEEKKITQMLPAARQALTEFAQQKSPPHNPTDE